MFRCPLCKSEDLEVWISVPHKIERDGTAVPKTDFRPSFDSSDDVECMNCHYEYSLAEFDIHEQPEDQA